MQVRTKTCPKLINFRNTIFLDIEIKSEKKVLERKI